MGWKKKKKKKTRRGAILNIIVIKYIIKLTIIEYILQLNMNLQEHITTCYKRTKLYQIPSFPWVFKFYHLIKQIVCIGGGASIGQFQRELNEKSI